MTEANTTVQPRGLPRPRLGVLGAGGSEGVLAELAASALAGEVLRPESLEDLPGLSLDGVIIAASHAERAALSIAALNAGLPVFCDHPVGRMSGETRAVIAAARQHDLLLGANRSFRFTEAMRVLRSVVQAGELGDVYAVDLVFHSSSERSSQDRRRASGGCVLDLGADMIDLALWTLGFPRVTNVTSRLFARGEPLLPGDIDGVEDYATALLDLDTGACLRLACSWNLPAGRNAIIEASFYGTEGGGSFHNERGSRDEFSADLFRGVQHHSLATPPDDWRGRAVADWAARVAAGERYDPWIEGAIDVSTALDAILAR